MRHLFLAILLVSWLQLHQHYHMPAWLPAESIRAELQEERQAMIAQ
jgi:hypothetical protein